ncbi:hypothetical protein F4780DRAFT_786365 [Xylariomycetidae sp. FL0641]|nr:hypothetical protein F4780DRAFT_786365 [Xylariomycetidae sp. FL0641]
MCKVLYGAYSNCGHRIESTSPEDTIVQYCRLSRTNPNQQGPGYHASGPAGLRNVCPGHSSTPYPVHPGCGSSARAAAAEQTLLRDAWRHGGPAGYARSVSRLVVHFRTAVAIAGDLVTTATAGQRPHDVLTPVWHGLRAAVPALAEADYADVLCDARHTFARGALRLWRDGWERDLAGELRRCCDGLCRSRRQKAEFRAAARRC